MTQAQFVKTYFPALAVPARDPTSQAISKLDLARAMFAARGEYVEGLPVDVIAWIDDTAAMTPPCDLRADATPLHEAHARYQAARAGWSLLFAEGYAARGMRL